MKYTIAMYRLQHTFDPLKSARRAILQARAGARPSFEEGQVGDIERDALAEGLPLWLWGRSGLLYIASNAAWPGLYKIGCTRRTVPTRMRQLNSAGLATPWLARWQWHVHDAFGLEALIHRDCDAWRVTGEMFQAPVEELKARIDGLVELDRRLLVRHLEPYWPDQFLSPISAQSGAGS